ncbi:MAG: DUF6340 family protein [Salinivirgaceae bacterium]|nr:DUF6340 family protein [Salinivirgaceae bacterium]MDD4745749.1 DUF6340 family protein [Salinivirgaceae bacterium]MDY0279290.1 DUF6340 family protein [Salinivirgaceae bacterium]
MKIKNALIFATGLLIFMLTSCNVVQKVRFEVLIPADTIVEIQNRNIDIVNTYFNTNPKPIDDKSYDKWQFDSLFSFACIETVYSSIKESGRFIPQRVDTAYNRTKSYNDKIELTHVDLRTSVLSEPVKDYYSGLYKARVRIDYWVKWEILNSDGKTVFNKDYTDTVWVEGSKSSFTSLSDLVNIDKATYYILEKTAIDFARKISPHWRGTYRYIFTTGHNDFVMAEHYISKNEWEKAEQIWLQFEDSNNKNLSGKANYNLAVKNERDGKLLLALEYAKKAYETHRFAQARELVSILRGRINNVAKIESQIP